MTNTHKLVLEHCYKLLNSLETHHMYSNLSIYLENLGVDSETRYKILERFLELVNEQFNKCNESKKWIDSIISDLKS